MVKRWTICAVVTIVSGCALINAAQGNDDDDDNNVIQIDTNNDENNTPNNVENNDNNENNDPDGFTPERCAWVGCPCGSTGCDPRTDCTPFPCFTCEDNSHCGAQGGACNVAGRCNSCETYFISIPEYYTSPAGEDYVCETDEFSQDQICLLYECYPEFSP